MRKHMFQYIICLVAAIFMLVGCGMSDGVQGTSEDRVNGKISIVTTLFPQYDFAKQIGGDYVDVTLVLLPGMESHTYDPTPKDMIGISEADLFIYTGAEMEPWAEELVDSVNMSRVRIVDASEGVELVKMAEEDHEAEEHDHETEEHDHEAEEHDHETEEHDHEAEEHSHGHGHGHAGHSHEYDPHIWLDIQNAMQMVENIVDALVEVDPAHADEYRANAEAYLEQLADLDAEMKHIVEESPRHDVVFGGHFAHGYFIDAYGLDFESVYDSISEEAEPSIGHMMHVIEYMQEYDVKYILYEELSTPNIARAVAEAAGAQMRLFYSCHNVTKDQFESGVTYIDLMKANAETLRIILQ